MKKSCSQYFETDYGNICNLVIDELCESGECIGYAKINDQMESIACEIAHLTNKYNKLQMLKETLEKQSQNKGEYV
jgi:hypothetical protein